MVKLAQVTMMIILVYIHVVCMILMTSIQLVHAAAVEVVLVEQSVHHQINATLDKEIAPVIVIALMA